MNCVPVPLLLFAYISVPLWFLADGWCILYGASSDGVIHLSLQV